MDVDMSEQLSVTFGEEDYDCIRAMALLKRTSTAAEVVSAIRTEIGSVDIDALAKERVAQIQAAAATLQQYNLVQAQGPGNS